MNRTSYYKRKILNNAFSLDENHCIEFRAKEERDPNIYKYTIVYVYGSLMITKENLSVINITTFEQMYNLLSIFSRILSYKKRRIS